MTFRGDSANILAVSTDNATNTPSASLRAALDAEMKLTERNDGLCHPYEVGVETDYYSYPHLPKELQEDVLLRIAEKYWFRLNVQEYFLQTAVDFINEGQLGIEALLKPIDFIKTDPRMSKVYSILACFKRVQCMDPALPCLDLADYVDQFSTLGLWLATLLARSSTMNVDTLIDKLQKSGTLGELDPSEMDSLIERRGKMTIETNSDIGVAKEVEQPQAFFWLPHGPKNLHDQVEEILMWWERALRAFTAISFHRTLTRTNITGLLQNIIEAAEAKGLA
ncbi:hypothetical protein PHISCL_05575 [Aspergillus sclerotialis]|uniref:Uncharacterized protein n=1 Tax=Aspergillus sclerotialis TaxID=2070753 RepID=A0A3A2ZFV1_9EURO|nr:hypothetical protein PHISCL_05575 [Aspergillus sclerotialis]